MIDPYTAIERAAQITLERRKYNCSMPISRELIETATVDLVRSFIPDQVDYAILKFSAEVYGRPLVNGEVEVHTRALPATWWDMWKAGDSDAARWVRKRWPVKYRKIAFKITLDRWANYPNASPTLLRAGQSVIVDYVRTEVLGS